jgi:DNA-binding NarL/FixJ family response regulator
MIVDDCPLFREGLRILLTQQGDFALVGEASTLASATRLAHDVQPDVILMDLSLPDGQGVEATRQIVAQQPQIHVIALTGHDEPGLLAAMAAAGAHGYILKDVRAAELICAVRTVVVTGVTLSPKVLPDLLTQYRRLTHTAGNASRLSPRELAILRLIAAGAGNREIAARLTLSTQTIKNYLSVIYEKLGVSNRANAVMAAIEKGLLGESDASMPDGT